MMTRFVAFLRGINVGGRVVKKEKLHEAFAPLGFQNIVVYKQSGNVIFDSDSGNTEEIKAKVEERLQATLGYQVCVSPRTIQQLKKLIHSEPFKGEPQEGTSFLVTLLPSPAPLSFTTRLPLTIPKSTAQVISAQGTEVFSVTHGGGEGALPNPFIEANLRVKTTTRNLNIIIEFVEKFDT